MTMKTTEELPNHSVDAKGVVLTFINALNAEDFDTAKNCVHDDLVFEGVLGTRDGAEAYFRDMEKMRLKYKIKKAFQDGNDVCILYDINMSGTDIFTCGWYQVEHGRIKSLKVVFDPRPVLQQSVRR
jgi:limonene-1,2-epoxide hydrolase